MRRREETKREEGMKGTSAGTKRNQKDESRQKENTEL